MKSRMKKIMAVLLGAAMVVSMAACGNSEDKESGGDKGTLEIAVTYTGNESTAFKELISEFEKESGYKVNVAEYGEDYESTMKTRMASNDLPDVFTTHGWSLLRYKEYLMNLKDEAWVNDYDESALGVIKDEDGGIYVMMISEMINGTLVNLDVCEKAGVDPYQIHTWQQFSDACAKIKAAGITPIGTNLQAGILANPGGTWTTYEGELAQDGDKMLDGSYDWSSYEAMLSAQAEWIEKGYYYEDIATMKDNEFTERYASGKAAFILGYDPSVLVTCLQINPDAKYAFLPHFASADNGQEFVGIGEGDAFGIWKDTKNEKAAKAFIEFMAKPESTLKMTAANGYISCLKEVAEQDESYGMQVFQTMKEKCADNNILYDNLWDRKYMPSGMWPIFENATSMLFDDHSKAGVTAAKDYLSENYKDLFETAKSE